MTVKGCNTRFIVGGVDLSGDTNTVGVTIAGRTLDYGVLQDCDVRKMALTPTCSIEQNGYYTGPAAGGLDATLRTYLASTTGVHVTTIYDTAAAVPFAYVQDTAYNSKYAAGAQVGQIIPLSSMWPTLAGSAARMIRGYQVAGAALTATGAVTGIDAGAAGAAGGKLYVFVTSITGTATNASIKLQSDSDPAHGTTVDEGTATFSAVGCQEVSLSGVVGRYLRMNVVSLGGATGFTVYAIACIDGITY